MLERIKKALSLSRHPGTTEQEAQQALRMAMRLMEKCKCAAGSFFVRVSADGVRFSVTQAAVLATMDEKEDKLKQ